MLANDLQLIPNPPALKKQHQQELARRRSAAARRRAQKRPPSVTLLARPASVINECPLPPLTLLPPPPPPPPPTTEPTPAAAEIQPVPIDLPMYVMRVYEQCYALPLSDNDPLKHIRHRLHSLFLLSTVEALLISKPHTPENVLNAICEACTRLGPTLLLNNITS